MATAAEPAEAVQVAPFAIEIDHPRNCDCRIQSIPGATLRSTIKATRTVKDAKTGEERIPKDQANHLGMLPEIPGMQLHVNPNSGLYRIIDPLHGNEELCEKIRKRLVESSPMSVASRINGVKPQAGELDIHRIKTLCREMIRMVQSGEAKVIKGTLPKMDEVEGMAGEFLLNPGAMVHNGQPQYERDWTEWVANLNRMGG